MKFDLDSWIVETYRSVFDRQSLLRQFEKLAQHFSSPYSALHLEGPSGPNIGFTTGVDIERIAAKYPHYENLWIERGTQQLFSFGVTHDDWHTPLKQMRATDYHHHILKPLDIDHSIGVLCDHQSDGSFAMLSLSRSNQIGCFDEESVRKLQVLQPHLQNILQLYRKVNQLEHQVLSFQAMLDSTAESLFYIDRERQILGASQNALKSLEEAEVVFRSVNGRLKLKSKGIHHQFQKLCRSHSSGQAMLWLDCHPNRHLLCIQLLHDSETPESRGSGQLLVGLKQLGKLPSANTEVLKTVFGFSNREAQLALSLAETFNLRRAAEALGIGHETARSYLKRLFSKTGTRNQAEFLAVIGELLN